MSELDISTFTKRNGEPYLPLTCWFSQSAGNIPVRMSYIGGGMIHKLSGAIAFPHDKYNKLRIVDEILVKYRVSYHAWIDQDGFIEQLVPLPFMAFHAGKSRAFKQDYCNNFTAGVALISDGKEFSDAMVESCAQYFFHLIKSKHWMGSLEAVSRIISHEYARDVWNGAYPNDKGSSRAGDPGNFPWDHFRTRLQYLLSEPA